MTKENLNFQKALAAQYASGYCREKGLSLEMLARQRIDIINNHAIFSQPSAVPPRGLVNDMDTMPIPTLIISFDEGKLTVQETENTKKYLS